MVNDDVVTKGKNLLSNCHQGLLTSSGQWRGSMLGLVPPRESDLGLLTRGVPTVRLIQTRLGPSILVSITR